MSSSSNNNKPAAVAPAAVAAGYIYDRDAEAALRAAARTEEAKAITAENDAAAYAAAAQAKALHAKAAAAAAAAANACSKSGAEAAAAAANANAKSRAEAIRAKAVADAVQANAKAQAKFKPEALRAKADTAVAQANAKTKAEALRAKTDATAAVHADAKAKPKPPQPKPGPLRREDIEKEKQRGSKIKVEFEIAGAYDEPVRYNAGNQKEQVLVRIPRCRTIRSFKSQLAKSRWLDHVMKQVVDYEVETQTGYEWVIKELKRRCPKAFDAVAESDGYSKTNSSSNSKDSAPKIPKIYQYFPGVQHKIVEHAKSQMNDSKLVLRDEMVRYMNDDLIPSLRKDWNNDTNNEHIPLNEQNLTHEQFLSKVLGITGGKSAVTQSTISCWLRLLHFVYVDYWKSFRVPDKAPEKVVYLSGPNHPQRYDKVYDPEKALESEAQCAAISTRGRHCLYTAQLGKKYCSKHADYDINPPKPKRRRISAVTNKTTAGFANEKRKQQEQQVESSSSDDGDSESEEVVAEEEEEVFQDAREGNDRLYDGHQVHHAVGLSLPNNNNNNIHRQQQDLLQSQLRQQQQQQQQQTHHHQNMYQLQQQLQQYQQQHHSNNNYY